MFKDVVRMERGRLMLLSEKDNSVTNDINFSESFSKGTQINPDPSLISKLFDA